MYIFKYKNIHIYFLHYYLWKNYKELRLFLQPHEHLWVDQRHDQNQKGLVMKYVLILRISFQQILPIQME